jgi:hypothetical protein
VPGTASVEVIFNPRPKTDGTHDHLVEVVFKPRQTERAALLLLRPAKSDEVQLDGSNQEFQASKSDISISP